MWWFWDEHLCCYRDCFLEYLKETNFFMEENFLKTNALNLNQKQNMQQ